MLNKVFLAFLFILSFSIVRSQVFIVDTTYSPPEIVNKYFLADNHNGIKIENIRYSGLNIALGLFYYEGSYNALPRYGLILSSGSVLEAIGPNNHTASIENYTYGDADLSKIVNTKTFDSAILEFDFTSFTDSINFVFQFASEEYPEYVNRGVSDVFGFFISDSENEKKKNIAVLENNGTPIAIDLINKSLNPEFYSINNSEEYNKLVSYERKLDFNENMRLFQFDGFTKPISSGMRLIPFKRYHFKIAIADAGDRKFDSWILLKGNSFISNGNFKKPNQQNIIEYFSNVLNDSLDIYSDEEKVHIMLPIYFNYNSYTLKNESNKVLEPLLDLLMYSDYNLVINGFADETGSVDYNLKLSKKRSEEVKKYLVDKGIQESRINSFGKGEVDSGEEYEKSRKVEFILY